MVLLTLLAFLIGIPMAWLFGQYVYALNNKQPGRAAACDFIVLFMGKLGCLSLWSAAGDSPLVLLSFALGNALGTYFVVSLKKGKR